MLERQDDLCREYTCCGLNLIDLFALVKHFEECRALVLGAYVPQQPLPLTIPFLSAPAGQQIPIDCPDVNIVSASSQRRPQRVQVSQQAHSVAYQSFDPHDMELDVDQSMSSASSSGAPLLPGTPTSTPFSGYPSPTPSVATISASPSPHYSLPASPISAFDPMTVLPPRSAHHPPHHLFRPMGPSATRGLPEDAFDAYAGCADDSSPLPDAVPNASLFLQQDILAPMNDDQNGQHENGAVYASTAPILSSSAESTPDLTPASSPIPSGSDASSYKQLSRAGSSSTFVSLSSWNVQASDSGSAAQTARASMTLSRSVSSLLLSKAFKRPGQNCNKAYKEAKGLEYHLTRGCNFAPPEDLAHLRELLVSKCSEKVAASEQTADEGEVTLSNVNMREVETEAERRLKPYACEVGACLRRFKSMIGLRYHYLNSGHHGVIGLALLASGQPNKSQRATPSHSNSNSNSAPSAQQMHERAASQYLSPSPIHQQPQYVPQAQQPQQQQQPPTYENALANPPAYSYRP